MVKLNLMRTTTNRTGVLPIFEGEVPLFRRVVIGKRGFTSAASLKANKGLAGVCCIMLSTLLQYLVAVNDIVFPFLTPDFIYVSFPIFHATKLIFLRMQVMIYPLSFGFFFSVVVILLALFPSIFLSIFPAPFSMGFFDFIRVVFIVALTIKTRTGLANSLQSIGATTIFMKLSNRLKSLARRTAFQRGIHSASLSLYLKWLSAGGEISRRFGLQSLADNSIISWNAALINHLTAEKVTP